MVLPQLSACSTRWHTNGTTTGLSARRCLGMQIIPKGGNDAALGEDPRFSPFSLPRLARHASIPIQIRVKVVPKQESRRSCFNPDPIRRRRFDIWYG